jgi:hypothetical protein
VWHTILSKQASNPATNGLLECSTRVKWFRKRSSKRSAPLIHGSIRLPWTVLPESLDETPRGGGRRQHLSEHVNDDQDIHRHRLPTGQGDAAIRSLCRNSNTGCNHSEQDNSSKKCLSSTPFVLTRCAACSAWVILAASGCYRRPPKMVLLLFQPISQLARETCSGDSAYGIGVMQNDFCS